MTDLRRRMVRLEAVPGAASGILGIASGYCISPHSKGSRASWEE